MQLEKIITLANKNSELRFLAMVRSLRDKGCNLPVWVIPYDDKKFVLPENCIWWEVTEITSWLYNHRAHSMMRKYQCLVTANYQYVDSDIIFIRNPQEVLHKLEGFVTCCGHWHNPEDTCTEQSIEYFKSKSTTWQKLVFNAGQFACDTELYNVGRLIEVAESPEFIETCLYFKFHDQPGLNLLVNASGANITNITLPPYNTESSWAGDYIGDYQHKWQNEHKTPYIIHWAGCQMNTMRPIDQIFLKYLTDSEKQMWNYKLSVEAIQNNRIGNRIRRKVYRLKKAVKLLK